ncbi:MAG: hypothetical protein WBQ85_16860 [Candidatus Sulfotelmatobacter sp.]
MRRTRFTKPIPLIAGLLSGLLVAILAVPLGAQPVPKAQPYYDIAREVTLNGTVSSVVSRPKVGAHLELATSSGAVNADLGRWAFMGKGALHVTAGARVEVTGVMKTYKDRQVFIARTVKLGSQVYTMRNQHGIPVSPQTRARAGQKPAPFNSRAAQKGESL